MLYFPVFRWLDGDEGDKKTEREIFPLQDDDDDEDDDDI